MTELHGLFIIGFIVPPPCTTTRACPELELTAQLSTNPALSSSTTQQTLCHWLHILPPMARPPQRSLKPHPARLFTTAHLFTQPLVVHPAQPQGPAPHLSSPLLSLLHTPGDCVDGGRRPHLSLGGGALSGESSGVHRSMLTMDRVRPRLEAP